MQIFFLTVFIIISSSLSAQRSNLCDEKLFDYKGLKIDNDSLKSGTTIFFITSYTCGPCIKSIPKYESLRFLHPKVRCIGILDNDSLYIENFRVKNKQEFWFAKISDPKLILSKKYWKKQVWPEFHIYHKGKLVQRLVDASDKTFEKLIRIISKLEMTN